MRSAADTMWRHYANLPPVALSHPPRTHAEVDTRFSGVPLELEPGRARVRLDATAEMAADDRGLVHGGFVFSAADHAAMLAVNEPTVVLAGAEVRFVAPVRVGESVVFEARVESGADADDRPLVRCSGTRGEERVFEGTFQCAVLPEHVLERSS